MRFTGKDHFVNHNFGDWLLYQRLEEGRRAARTRDPIHEIKFVALTSSVVRMMAKYYTKRGKPAQRLYMGSEAWAVFAGNFCPPKYRARPSNNISWMGLHIVLVPCLGRHSAVG